MLLGGTLAGQYPDKTAWEQALIRSRFKAITAPFTCQTPRTEIDAYCEILSRRGVRIAEIGVWKNLMDPDPASAAEAMAFAKGQLALADERGIPCCVNIAGTKSALGWDAADESNFQPDTYDLIVRQVQEILDDVKPRRAFYTLEPMPWMLPDGPDEYLQLMRDVNRPQFAVHLDFVNMLCTPRRCLDPLGFLEECLKKLGPFIKSTHIKDSRMDRTRLTSFFQECSPGEGDLDYGAVLQLLDQYLPQDAPVLLEHMTTFEEYAAAYDYVAGKAAEAGVSIG